MPVCNEEASIEPTVRAVHESLRTVDFPYELIVVDDGSTDGTPQALARCLSCTVLRHPTNRGYGAALKTGIQHAGFPLVAILDADGTYPVERLPQLVQLAENVEMVVGSRVSTPFAYQWSRRLAKWFLTRFAELLIGRSIPDLNSGMRVFRRQFAERHLDIFPDGFSFTTTITLAQMTDGRSVHFEPIPYRKRVGRSKIRPLVDTWNMARTIVRTVYHFAPGRVIVPLATAGSLLLALSLAWNMIQVPQATDKVVLMLANLIQLGMVFLLADLFQQRAEATR
ncbi:MAG: glycosyltransferase family 2 protein [Pirellulaceae bacterium]|nr:glycosyltransferase family 2 protein [Pirellulaceae bacterium]